MNYNNKQRNTFQSRKEIVVEDFSLKTALFPELINTNINNTVITSISYKNILLEPVSENVKPFIRIKEVSDRELELKEKRDYQNKAIEVISKMAEEWLQKRLAYIDLYGEDEYERWYIPLKDWDKAINGEESESEDDLDSSDEEDYEY